MEPSSDNETKMQEQVRETHSGDPTLESVGTPAKRDHEAVEAREPRSTIFNRIKAIFAQKPRMKPTILGLSILTMLFSILSVSRCTFMERRAVQSGLKDHVKIGLFKRAFYDLDGDFLGCVQYTDEGEFDAKFRAGRAFGTLTAIWSIFAFLLISTALFACPKNCHVLWKMARGLFVTASISQLLTFLAIGGSPCTSSDCVLTGVGVLAVFNAFILIGLSIVSCLEPPPISPWFAWWNADQHTVKRETLEFADSDDGPGYVGRDEVGNFLNADNFSDAGVLELEVEDIHRRQVLGADPSVSGVESVITVNTQQSTKNLPGSVGVQGLVSFRLLTFALIVCIWSISIVGVQHCTFILVGPSTGSRSEYSGIGLYSRATYNDSDLIGCTSYPDASKDEFDSAFVAARVFGALTALIMSIALLLCAVQLFVHIANEEIWFSLRALLPCAIISQLLTFLAYATNTCTASNSLQCVPGGTGIVVLLNLFLMIAASVITCIMPPPPFPVFTKWTEEKSQKEEDDDEEESLVILEYHAEESASQMPRRGTTTTGEESRAGKLSVLPEESRSGSSITGTEGSAAHEDNHADAANISRIFPIPSQLRPSSEQTESITVRVEFAPGEKKTIKEITHPDGSKTITTTIEELPDDSSFEPSVLEDDASLISTSEYFPKQSPFNPYSPHDSKLHSSISLDAIAKAEKNDTGEDHGLFATIPLEEKGNKSRVHDDEKKKEGEDEEQPVASYKKSVAEKIKRYELKASEHATRRLG